MKESNAVPKSKSHWISTILIVAPRLVTAAADEADGGGLVSHGRGGSNIPWNHKMKY